MHPAKQWHNETIARKTVEALERNDFDAIYAASAAEAREFILPMIPSGATIGFGGSNSVREIGLFDALKAGDFRLINPPWIERELSRQDRIPLRRQAIVADVFLTGTNAVTLDGKLVNTDATANRVVGLLFGPKKAIVVVGINKIVRNVEEALERVSSVAGPCTAHWLNYEPPCATTGVCSDCKSPARICRATVILHRRTTALDTTVVVVGEPLGF